MKLDPKHNQPAAYLVVGKLSKAQPFVCSSKIDIGTRENVIRPFNLTIYLSVRSSVCLSV